MNLEETELCSSWGDIHVAVLPLYYVFRYPLKAVRVMHTVAMRTEATMPEEEAPANLGRAFKVTAFILQAL